MRYLPRVLFLALAAAHSGAYAQRVPSGAVAAEPFADRGPLSLVLSAGQYAGFGGGIGIGTRHLGARAMVGWAPLLVLTSGSHVDFYSGFQLGPDLYYRLIEPRPRTDIGATIGYRYNSLLGHGIAAGGYAEVLLNRALDLNVSFGLLVFPDGEDHLRSEEGIPGASFSFPGPAVNVGLSVGLAFFP